MILDGKVKSATPITVVNPGGDLLGVRLNAFWQRSELIRALAMRSIRTRFRGTKFGILWAFAHPLFYMLIINAFFGSVLRFNAGDVPYPLHLLTGLVAFQLFTKGIGEGANSISGNQGILTRIYIPPIVFPAASILSGLVDFLFPVLLLIGFLVFYKVAPTWNLIFLPVILFFLAVLYSGAQILMSVAAVRFKDLRMMVPVITQLLFFGTPIFYSMARIPEKYRLIMAMNPMMGIIEGLRWSVLGKDVPPNPEILMVSGVMVLVIVVTALVTFRSLGRKLSNYVV